MSTYIQFIEGLLQLKNVKGEGNEEIRVFIPSEKINIFPCSRRGQKTAEGSMLNYDPEARLNTERTNRLRTSINGFTDSFIDSFTKNKDENGNDLETGTLVFVLAGYRIEVKEIKPSYIAAALGIAEATPEATIYAHLSLHDGIPFGVANYYTEILYRQSTNADNNYIDVKYTDTSANVTSDFFMGVSFTKEAVKDSILVKDADKELASHDLELFSKVDGNWKLVEASKLPKVEHDTEPDSIKLSGNFTVRHPVLNVDGTPTLGADGKPETLESFKVTKDETILGNTVMSSLIVGEKTDGDTFTNGTIKVKEHIETPTLEATTKIDTPLLNVTDDDNSGQANIDNATITGELRVQNEGDAKLFADAVNITGTLQVSQGDTTLKKLTAENTTLDNLAIAGEAEAGSALTVNGKGTVKGDLEITTKTSTPTLEVNTTKANEIDAAKITANEIWLDTADNKPIGQVPALELYHFKNGPYQLRFKFGTPITIIEE